MQFNRNRAFFIFLFYSLDHKLTDSDGAGSRA